MSTTVPADEKNGFEVSLNLPEACLPPIVPEINIEETAKINKDEARAVSDDSPAAARNMTDIGAKWKNATSVANLASDHSDDGSALSISTAKSKREINARELIARLDTDGSGGVVISQGGFEAFFKKENLSSVAARSTKVGLKRDGGATDDAYPSPSRRATKEAAGAVAKKPSSIDSTQMKSVGDDFGEAEIGLNPPLPFNIAQLEAQLDNEVMQKKQPPPLVSGRSTMFVPQPTARVEQIQIQDDVVPSPPIDMLSVFSISDSDAAKRPATNQLPSAGVEQVHDNIGPSPPTGTLAVSSISDSDVIKRKLQNQVPSAGVEQVHDNIGPSRPIDMLAVSSISDSDVTKRKLQNQLPSAGVEQVHDSLGPSRPISMLSVSSISGSDVTKRKLQNLLPSAGVEQVHGSAGPSPPAGMLTGLFEAPNYCQKMAATGQAAAMGLIPPVPDNIAQMETQLDDEEMQKKPPAVIDNQSPLVNDDDIPIQDDGNHTNVIANPDNANQVFDASARPILQQGANNDSTPLIPEAYLVENGSDEVIIATHLETPLPWLKQKRTKVLFVLFLIIMAIFSIVLVVTLSRESVLQSSPPLVSNTPTIQPTTAFPSIQPTSVPSSSASPSSMPTECVRKILSTSTQKIELPLVDPFNPQIAVDGANMVVVTRDSRSKLIITVFYSLVDDEWIIKNAFQEEYNPNGWWSADLSGKTAFVGFPYHDSGGAVTVYGQNNFGFWEKTEEPFVHGDNVSYLYFGNLVYIDGDLALVSDYNDIFLFRRDGNKKWVQFDVIYGRHRNAVIAGDTIAVCTQDVLQLYKFDKDTDGFVPLQEPIVVNVNSIGLSNDYLVYVVYTMGPSHLFVYHREEGNQTFTIHQELNSSVDGKLALDNDILVIEGDNHTDIFSEQDGKWVKTITLDQPYHSYHLSGRHLLASTGDKYIFSFNIEDCAPTPTQMPSSSKAPTTCYLTKVEIEYNGWADSVSWELFMIDMRSNAVEIQSYVESEMFAASYNTSICLQEGEYEFIIYNTRGVGLCCFRGYGHYNVTSSGALLAHGTDFGDEDKTRFSLPITQALSAVPSLSESPSLSLSPTFLPSSS